MDFYPRPPRGGRLQSLYRKDLSLNHFYPRPPRGGRLTKGYEITELEISIHALREEGDAPSGASDWEVRRFLSTPSARRATGYQEAWADYRIFLSTPSARRATGYQEAWADYRIFLSTPSARRATGGDSDVPTHGKISIHALREEGDLVMLGNTLGTLMSIHALREEGDFGSKKENK